MEYKIKKRIICTLKNIESNKYFRQQSHIYLINETALLNIVTEKE